IKAGINIINMDSMRERVFAPALHGFLDTIREGKPGTPIVVVSPIFCPSAENAPGPTLPDGRGKFVTLPGHAEIRTGCMSLTRVRQIIAEVIETRTSAGDQNLHYVDGLTLFGAADAGDLPDDLHPNPAGYIRMGSRFAPTLKAIAAGRLIG
ncbi:MAG: lipase, partial [Proteobacteria bacterium]|nr:lipase [Pseudomonadota bacterium]